MDQVEPSQSTVLCTWELGGQLGHIARLAHIALQLETQGYRCYAALKDLSRAKPFFEGSQCRLLQAPVFLPKIKMQRPAISLADTLLLTGYLKAEELSGLTDAWANLIQLVNPEVLVMDYSPTAALAALALPCRKIIVGTGFWQPVPGHPIRSWITDPSQSELVKRQEQMVVKTINEVLTSRQHPPISYIADLFTADRIIINTPPEFDYYGDIRQDGLYHSKSGAPGINQPVQFGAGTQPKVLAYLKPGHPQFDLIVKGLALSSANVFIACPRCDPKRLSAYQSERFNFSVEPVQLADAMSAAGLFVGHGSSASTQESILAGTPVIVLPIQLEQLATAQSLHQLKLGQVIPKVDSAEQFARIVDSALASHELKQNAEQYAQKRAHTMARTLADVVVEECDALLENKKGR